MAHASPVHPLYFTSHATNITFCGYITKRAYFLFPVRVALKLEHAPSVSSLCNKQASTEHDIPAFVTKCLWSFVLMKPIHHLNNHQDDPELSDHHPSLPSYLASEHNRTRPPCYHSALTLSITHTCWLSLGPTTSSPMRTAARATLSESLPSLPSTALRNELHFFSSLPSSSFFFLQHILCILPYAPAVTRASYYLWMGLAPGIGGLKSDQSTTSWCLMRACGLHVLSVLLHSPYAME